MVRETSLKESLVRETGSGPFFGKTPYSTVIGSPVFGRDTRKDRRGNNTRAPLNPNT